MPSPQPGSTAHSYDIIICGAGPAGTACALALKDAGLRVAMIDKATFPRDKVCGDAIPGRAIKTLERIGPQHAADFRKYAPKLITRSTALYYGSRRISFNWVGEAYTCTRMHFDHFLYMQVAEAGKTSIYTGTSISSVARDADGYTLTAKDGQAFRCRLLIGADGAHSVTAKALAHRTLDRNNHVGSVRTFYTNVHGLDPHTTEVYFDKKYLPSYLWIFPLPGGAANVGFGMLSSEIARRKINLRDTFNQFIAGMPALQHRLAHAHQECPPEGFGLPLGATDVTISGERFMLAGDAASLIDPITGDGIGNSMLSGRLAAEQAIQCFRQNNFSATFIAAYNRALHAAIGSELRTHYHARRILARMPLLLDIAFAAGSSPWLRKLMQKAL